MASKRKPFIVEPGGRWRLTWKQEPVAGIYIHSYPRYADRCPYSAALTREFIDPMDIRNDM